MKYQQRQWQFHSNNFEWKLHGSHHYVNAFISNAFAFATTATKHHQWNCRPCSMLDSTIVFSALWKSLCSFNGTAKSGNPQRLERTLILSTFLLECTEFNTIGVWVRWQPTSVIITNSMGKIDSLSSQQTQKWNEKNLKRNMQIQPSIDHSTDFFFQN